MSEPDPGTVLVGEGELRGQLERLLGALGTPAERAVVVADNLVEADLRGVDSHGANLMALYHARVTGGHLFPDAPITTVEDRGSTARLDAGLGFGQVAGVRAMDLATARAAEHGVATVTVRELTHLGALGYYTARAAEAGYLAMVFQNGPAIVPPYGGTTGVFSTNPFSYAVPAGANPPVVYDVATTAAAGNKILLARKRGDASIPPGWANDEEGHPTTDPQAASVFQLQWAAGHKGFGLAMLVEIMGGVLADSCYGTVENSASELAGRDRIAKGAAFVALDVSRFLPRAEFERRVDALIADVHASALAPGTDRIYVPGEIEAERREQRRRLGIPLSRGLVEELDRVAAALGCPPLVP